MVYKKWWEFTKIHNIETYSLTTSKVISFLGTYFQGGASYATLNIFISAINLI